MHDSNRRQERIELAKAEALRKEGAAALKKLMIQRMEGMQAVWSRLPVEFEGELRAAEMFVADLKELEPSQ